VKYFFFSSFCGTFPPPLRPCNLPCVGRFVRCFPYRSGHSSFPPGHPVGAPRSAPALHTRLITRPRVMSTEFCAVFPTGRKNRTNGLHFSCRQETRSGGFLISNSLSALSPRPAPRLECRKSSAGPRPGATTETMRLECSMELRHTALATALSSAFPEYSGHGGLPLRRPRPSRCGSLPEGFPSPAHTESGPWRRRRDLLPHCLRRWPDSVGR